MTFEIGQIKKIGIHIIFWLGYYFLTFYWFSLVNELPVASLISFRIVAIHMALFYLNTQVLLPEYINKGNYLLYFLVIVALLVLVFYFIKYTNEWLSIRQYVGGRRGVRPAIFPRMFFGRGVYLSLGSSMAILFISSTYWINQQNRIRIQEESDLKNQNLEAEMKFLKSQTNPHFLFNALNNIYALSYTGSTKASEMIMKLSDMLRYVLYESNEKQVPLSNELDYIKNYIDFQALKIEGKPNIETDFSIDSTTIQVEPMLFIPFIENSFKHSKIENVDKGWIKIQLNTNQRDIEFTVENSVPIQHFAKDATGGIGLANVKKRLALLYPNDHMLIIKSEKETFSVNLIITT